MLAPALLNVAGSFWGSQQQSAAKAEYPTKAHASLFQQKARHVRM